MSGGDEILVSTEWLESRLGSDELRVLDASWYLPSEHRDPKQEFLTGHIVGAQYFDINCFSDPNHSLPHMVPSKERFCKELEKLGVDAKSIVVFYDGLGMFSAARAWWLLKLFGFSKVYVLNGGLPKWVDENKSLTTELVTFASERVSTPSLNSELVRDWKQVKTLMEENPKQIIDARSPDRFNGSAVEPRPGLRSGHIPGSTNICYKELLNDDFTVKDKESLLRIFNSKEIDLTAPIIATCGSGVTAAILFLSLEIIGARNKSIYDGSWSEWGQREDLLVETKL